MQHEDAAPHNAQSLYYQYRFYGLHGRWPTWADALAHCDERVRMLWKLELQRREAWTEPAGGEPIAEPPSQSVHELIGMGKGVG